MHTQNTQNHITGNDFVLGPERRQVGFRDARILKHRKTVPSPAWASAHRGKWGQLPPPTGKWIKKIKKRKHAKSSIPCLCYILRAIRAGRCRERLCADHIFIQIYFSQNAPFRGQIFKVFFASGGQGALIPLTKILRTFFDHLLLTLFLITFSPRATDIVNCP